MRTTAEITAHIKRNNAFFDFTGEVLGAYLPYSAWEEAGLEAAKGVDVTQITPKPIDHGEIKKEMLDYLSFAWGKCEDHRGLSAQRSISKLRAWVWLLEDAESIEFLSADSNYLPYGAPMLAFVARKYGSPLPTGTEIEMMISGQPCPYCE